MPVQTERYERLLQGVASATNVLLTSLNYRRSIDRALAILGEATQVDRLYIFETHTHPVEKMPAMSQRWEWAAPGVTPEIDNPELQNLLYRDSFPRWYKELSQSQPIFGPVCDFPPEEKEILEPQGILSILVVPIRIQSRFWGFVGFDQCQTVHAWTDVEISTLWAIAGSFGGTIARHRAEVHLQELNHTLESRVDERTQALTIANRDLSAAMKSLQDTQTQLIRTEKMSSLGQLVAGIAHEINNPANFISGNLMHAQHYCEDLLNLIELYQTEYPQATPKLKEAIKKIDLEFLKQDFVDLMFSAQGGVERISHIVRSLRNFSRLDEAECKHVDIHSGLDSALHFLQHRLKPSASFPGIEVIRQFDENLPMVQCFSGSLNQAITNILTNSIDALEEKTWEAQTQRPNQIIVKTEVASESQIVIQLSDNANGMSHTIQEKIFDPFFTSKPIGKGTGLGLSIAHQIIVKEHGGDLTCQSVVGKGTTFIMTLPKYQTHP